MRHIATHVLRPRIARTIERLGLSDSVALLGWHDHGRLAQFYQHCQVGLLPFLDTPHVRITLANKLFDYMGASLAVLAADLPPMERIVAETGAGLLYPVGSTEALAAQLVGLLREPDRCRRLGERGREAVVTKYNWESEFVGALHTIQELHDQWTGRDGARS